MKSFFRLCLLSILLFSCSEKDLSKIVVDPGFSNYINAFTSGVISSQSTIKIVLIEPNPNAKVGEIIAEDLFEFDPEIKGQAYWLDDQTIEFRPDNMLSSGETYLAEFELGKIMEVPDDFETLEFGFMVITQSLFVSFEGLRSLDDEDFSKQELFGTVRTSDVGDPAKVEECLVAKQDGNELELSWTHEGKVHRFTVGNVERRKAESFVNLEWDGEAIGSESSDELEVRIPPLGEFTLVQVSTKREPGLHFSLQFSDPVDPRQELTGLVYLESGKELKLTVEGNEIKAFPTEQLNSIDVVQIDRSIVNTKGNQLQESYKRTVQFNLEHPAVELIGEGVIMPTSGGGMRFPFRAVNLKAVNVRVLRVFEKNIPQFLQVNQLSGDNELTRVGRLVYDDAIDLITGEPIDYAVWNDFSIDLSNIINPEPGALYRVMISFERYQSLYPCSGEDGEAKPFKRHEPNLDDGRYYYGQWDWYDEPYHWDERDNPCKPSFYMYHDRGISANILASDFGIIAKEGAGNTYDVVVTDLRTTEPLSGVSIEAYNYQHIKVGEGSTNGDGLVQLKTKVKPYLLIAREGKQRGYLRVDNASSLSLSLFDVDGSEVKKGVKGFIYGERGVWRPGDTIFLSFMLEDKQNSLPESHPIVMELFDPLGKIYERKVSSKGVKGLYSFKFKTTTEDVTGMWRVKATVGNSEFYKSVKVETVKPNRLRIDLDFVDEVISHNQSIGGKLNADWLYGSPGANLDVAVEMEVDNMKTEFKGYDGYQFDDRSRRYNSSGLVTAKSQTNGDGAASLSFDFSRPNEAPGMLKMNFHSKVFEPGGDFSQDFVSAKYSPYESYVGLKFDGGTNWLTAINSEDSHPIGFVTVDEFGNPISRQVDIEIYDLDWNWWWESSGSSELTRYIRRRSDELIATSSIVTSNGKAIYDLKLPKPDWGRYMLRVIDPVSGHSASQLFYVRYPGWRSNDEGASEAASMISLESSKETYNVGEDVEITLPSGGVGRVYISLEKGDKVIDRFWAEAESGSTTIEFEATPEMAPNVYVSAVLIQPHGQDKNSLPIRMYGVVPVNVNDPKTHITPQISAPAELQPETEFTVSVSEKDGKAMAYTLAVVDEGLLGLTRFKTPSPWEHFYSKEALGVRSWDLYKYVMSAEAGKLASLMAIGGDEGLVYKEDEKANRFKPVVKYIGPFYLKSGQKKEHKLKLPNYIGAVRVMVVAGYEGAYGKAEKEIQVKQPLMVLSTLPRVLGPSETVKVPVSVITMDDKIKSVQVKVEANDMLSAKNGTSKTVNFNGKGEKLEFFEFEVARKLGIAKLKITASAGNEKAYEEYEVQVRPPNPEITKAESQAVAANGNWNYSYEAVGVKGTNSAVLQVSRIPDLNLEKHLSYLIRYPHGCIEQTTSSAFPQLFLSSLMELTPEQEDRMNTNVTAALNKLRSFQMSSGGFSYWPSRTDRPSEWGTNYAGHFMLEAKNKGFDLPPGLLEQWTKFQKINAAGWNRERYDEFGRYGKDLMQAYRLYTLALAGEPELGAMNRLRNDTKLSDPAAWRLAAAYALVGREDVANELASRSMEIPEYREMGYTYGSHVRDMAMILETMSYLGDVNRGGDLLKDIAKELSIGWHSTQTRAYAMLAVAKFTGGAEASDNYSFTVTVNGKTTEMNTDIAMNQFEVEEKDLSSGQVSFQNRSNQMLFVTFVQTGIPVENNDQRLRDDLQMEISYVDMSGNAIAVDRLEQGTDFKAIVKLSHPGIRSNYDEVALSQLFPSGWQISNTRIGSDEAESSSDFQYRDIRDDRVYTYFDLNRNQTKTFEVLLNATFVGRYYQPSVFCAPMYDETIQALEPGRWVEVVSKPKDEQVVN